MKSLDEQIHEDILGYLDNMRTRIFSGLLRGSVDDGKSTLIGRLSRVPDLEDQRSIEGRLKEEWDLGGDLDFSLLVDGLQAEREQGITIDVAYRFSQRITGNTSSQIRLAMKNILEHGHRASTADVA